MINQPLVSILIPTYNRPDLLKETLKSVLNLDYTNWECIIVDDFSEPHFLEKYSKLQNLDSRFKFYNKPTYCKKGASNSRNYAFENSKGQFIQYLDDDDLIASDKISKQIHSLKGNFNSIITCSWDYYWPNKEIEIKQINNGNGFEDVTSVFSYLIENLTFIPIHSFLIPRHIIVKSGNWDETLTLNDDAEFMTRIYLNSTKILNQKDTYVLYRFQNQERLSGNTSDKLESNLESLRLISSHLKAEQVNAKPFLKWKLFKIFIREIRNKKQKHIIISYKQLFHSVNIYLSLKYYYILKYETYKKIYPFIKRLKKFKRGRFFALIKLKYLF